MVDYFERLFTVARGLDILIHKINTFPTGGICNYRFQKISRKYTVDRP